MQPSDTRYLVQIFHFNIILTYLMKNFGLLENATYKQVESHHTSTCVDFLLLSRETHIVRAEPRLYQLLGNT